MSLENAILELAKVMNRVADGLNPANYVESPLKSLKEKGFEFNQIQPECAEEIPSLQGKNYEGIVKEEKPKRTRAKKDTVEVVLSPATVIVEATEPNPPEDIKQEIEFTLEDCLDTLRAYLAKHKDYASSQALLQHFNVEILGDLPESKFKEFIELANKGKFGAK
ncbi:MAG: hypothetical protein ACRC6O_13335 [Flavobacterium sp.]